jgi:hypothetical protein
MDMNAHTASHVSLDSEDPTSKEQRNLAFICTVLLVYMCTYRLASIHAHRHTDTEMHNKEMLEFYAI